MSQPHYRMATIQYFDEKGVKFDYHVINIESLNGKEFQVTNLPPKTFKIKIVLEE